MNRKRADKIIREIEQEEDSIFSFEYKGRLGNSFVYKPVVEEGVIYGHPFLVIIDDIVVRTETEGIKKILDELR